MTRKQITDWAVYFVVRLFLCLIQAVRIETCAYFSSWLAVLASDVLCIRRQVVDENLRHVFPEWSLQQRRSASRKMWQHLLLMVCEIAQVPRKIHETNWRRYIRVHRKREIVTYLLDRRPTVIVSGHFGNFEMAAYTAGLLGFPTYAIARPLDNPYLHEFINRFRSSKGQFMLPTQGTADQVQLLLQRGAKLALLGDQHAGAKGCWVDFLGRPASCHKALAVFTLTAGAPMIVAYAKRTSRPLHFEMGVQATVDPQNLDDQLAGVKPLTQWYNCRLEELIRGEPAQYWWLHRRWKGAPPRRRKKQTPGSDGTVTSDRRQAA